MENSKDKILHNIDKNLNANNMLENWYNDAIIEMNKNSINSYINAICFFKMLLHLNSNYKDCETKIKDCNNKIKNIKREKEIKKIKEENKLKKEKKDKTIDKIKQTIKISLIVLAVIASITLFYYWIYATS